MADDRLLYDVPDDEYGRMSDEQRQEIDNNTMEDARSMMRLDELEDE